MIHARAGGVGRRPRYDRSMAARRRPLALAVVLCASLWTADVAAPRSSIVAAPAPPRVAAELGAAVERARERFEARDLAGVLAGVSEQYRSGGLTKAAVRDQLAAMFALYPQLRARVTIDRVELVDERAWIYTSGEVTGRLPFLGWVTVLTWQGEPEVARREPAGWRLFGHQD
jgi:hypothetical protein